MFTNFYTTVNGQRYIARSMEDGKKLVLTKSAFGKGTLPAGVYPVSAEALISKLGEMPFTAKETSNSELKITTNFSNYINKKILPAFHLTEMGIYGKIQNSDGSTDAGYPEKLIFYGCCDESEADYIPAVLTEFIINWSVAVTGEATIESVIDESLVYASQGEVRELEEATLNGYHKASGNFYSGPAGNYGIEVGKIEGRSVQEGTPAPSSPVEVQSATIGEFVSNGKNLFDVETALTTQLLGSVNAAGAYTRYGNGVQTNWNSHDNGRTYICLPLRAGKYNLSANVSSGNKGWNFSVKNQDIAEDILTKNYTGDCEISEAFTVSEDCLVGFCFMSLETAGPSTFATDIQLEIGNSKSDFVPWRGSEKVTLANPIVLRGIGEVCDTYENGVITRRIGVVDLSTLSWALIANWYQASISNMRYVRANTEVGNALCDGYVVRQATGFTESTVGEFAVDVSNVKFKTSGGTPTGLLFYELATPTIEVVEIPAIPSWAPNTSVHHDSEVEPTSIEWHIKNGVPGHTHSKSQIEDFAHTHNFGELSGVAPSGWGYGGAMEFIQDANGTTFESDLNTILAGMPNYSAKQIQIWDVKGLIDKKFVCTLWRYTESYATLEGVNYDGNKAIKCMYGGVWNPWEWVNPPMAIGTEYRTTRRYKGKPVYVMAVSLGIMPSSSGSQKNFTVGQSGDSVYPIDYSIVIKNSSNECYKLPMITKAGAIQTATGRLGGARTFNVFVQSDLSAYTGEAYVEYIKQ